MTTGQPLVSIILCNYKYGRYLTKAIDSVLCQTYANFELIIVDDGSTDDSREIIARYEDPRMEIVLQENLGQAAALNAGFARANGGLVAFLDSDDWWKREKLEVMIGWDRFLQGDYAVLQHGLDIWDNGNTNPYKMILPVGDCFAEMQRSGRFDFFVPTSGLFFRKAVLDQIFPIPIVFRIAADAYLTRTAFVFGNVYSIPNSLGFYRKHENAIYGNDNFDSKAFFSEILFPALNTFYGARGMDYQFRPSKWPTAIGIRQIFSWCRR